MKASEVKDLLRDMHSDVSRWVTAEEVPVKTGGGSRRLDFVAMECWESRGHALWGFEVKVSKADLGREIRDPSKHTCFFECLDYYSIAAPEEIVDVNKVPEAWGIAVVRDNEIRWRRMPQPLHGDRLLDDIPKSFTASFARRAVACSGGQDACRQAREQGIEAGTKRAFEEAENKAKRLQESIDAYKVVFEELGLNPLKACCWTSFEKAVLEEYAAFRELSLSSIKRTIPNAIEQLKELASLLEINVDGKGNEL